jgi:hypothetical protein
MLELSKVVPFGTFMLLDEHLQGGVLRKLQLQFHETFCALGQLTCLHLRNFDIMAGMDILVAEDIGSLTNLRCDSHVFPPKEQGCLRPLLMLMQIQLFDHDANSELQALASLALVAISGSF